MANPTILAMDQSLMTPIRGAKTGRAMKNLFKYTMLIAAAVMAFACSKSDEPAYETQDQAVKVAIAATSSIEVEGESRATLTPNEEDTYFTAAWEMGDQLAIRTEVSTDGTSFTGKESQGQLSYTGNGIFEGTLKTQEGAVAWNYYAYYPWTSSNSAIPFGDRVQNGNNYNSAYDLMLGECLGVQSELPGEGVALDMKRATALVYFHLTNTAEWAQTEKVTRLVLSSDKWFAGTAKYSTSKYIFSIESANRVNDIVMTFEEGTNPTAAELKAYFNIFPSGSSSKLTLTIYTEAHKLVIANPTGKKYEAGMLYKVAKDVSASTWADHNPGPLAAPVINTTPSVDHQSATFSWEAVANATGYAYTIDGGVEQTTTSTSVTISDLTPETAYSKTLAVRALGDGADYQDSEPASYTFAFTTEAAPAAGSTTTLTWDFSTLVAQSVTDPLSIAATENAARVLIFVAVAGKSAVDTGTMNNTKVTRVKMGGKSTFSGGVPASGYFAFTANGSGTLSITHASSSSSDTGRNTLIYVGSTNVATQEAPTDTKTVGGNDFSIDITVNGSETIYVCCDASVNYGAKMVWVEQN